VRPREKILMKAYHEEMQKLLGIPNLRTVKGYGRFPPTTM
jgi:hypothetical protein